MSKELTLSIVDQSPVRKNESAAQALQESIQLAKRAEQLGYSRYWVAEHHNTGSFAGTAPELLISQIATQTEKIRVGSAGIMLPHYSALKVAELFSILESFFPGRIDLGLGRAPGSDQLTAAALAYPQPLNDASKFPQQVLDLIGFLSGTLQSDHPFATVQAQPGPARNSIPSIWLLGSSNYSAQLAASLGLPFAFADFFGTTGDYGPLITELYRQEFKPSGILSEPKCNVSLQVICAETNEEAQFLGASRNINKIVQSRGRPSGLLDPQEANNYPLTPAEQTYVSRLTASYIDGDTSYVKEKILEAAERYGTSDVGIVTICHSFSDRIRSYELIADAFDLDNRDAPISSHQIREGRPK